jgi:hypothetical protein
VRNLLWFEYLNSKIKINKKNLTNNVRPRHPQHTRITFLSRSDVRNRNPSPSCNRPLWPPNTPTSGHDRAAAYHHQTPLERLTQSSTCGVPTWPQGRPPLLQTLGFSNPYLPIPAAVYRFTSNDHHQNSPLHNLYQTHTSILPIADSIKTPNLNLGFRDFRPLTGFSG